MDKRVATLTEDPGLVLAAHTRLAAPPGDPTHSCRLLSSSFCGYLIPIHRPSMSMNIIKNKSLQAGEII